MFCLISLIYTCKTLSLETLFYWVFSLSIYINCSCLKFQYIGLIISREMEMESMMVMEAENAMRRSFNTNMGSNYLCGGRGGGGIGFHHFNNLPFTSFSSISQLFSDAGMSNYGSYHKSPPPPLYSSLSLLPHQPPLLPLPNLSAFGNGLSAPSKKPVVATTVRSKNSMKKKKKKKKTTTKEVPFVKKPAVVNKEEEETGEEFLLSPLPSSLPLPRTLLTSRPKADSCSDDLRRLLRL